MDWDQLLTGLEAIAMHDHMPMHLGADLLQLTDEIKFKLGMTPSD